MPIQASQPPCKAADGDVFASSDQAGGHVKTSRIGWAMHTVGLLYAKGRG